MYMYVHEYAYFCLAGNRPYTYPRRVPPSSHNLHHGVAIFVDAQQVATRRLQPPTSTRALVPRTASSCAPQRVAEACRSTAELWPPH